MNEFFSSLFEDSGGWLFAVLDLIVVYYIVYILLLLIRGTRTVPMALGLLFLIVLYVVSQAMGLATTYMLLDQFMSVVVIFTLIIFQDDIRRALVRVGKFAWFAKAQETAVVEEVIRAASAMAAKRIGALIVFERDASLNEFILQAGTRLDASVTKELLYAIFIPALENPLHDGAAIIKDYHIRQAGVFVPLSSNPRIDKELGTRHRAALGITEQTDAVAVVVSEERGAISVCFEGHMSKDLDQAQLRKTLLNLFSKEKSRARRDAAKERETKAQKTPALGTERRTEHDGGAAAEPKRPGAEG
jgi:diadenylate cyclase